jgi:hypothetical protein
MTKFLHIKHEFENIPGKGFLIFNEFKANIKNFTIEDIIISNLLDEKYFSTEEQKVQTQKQLDQIITQAKIFGAYKEEETEELELYGPILKSKIEESDFEKLNYNKYLDEINNIKKEWSDNGWNYLVEPFNKLNKNALKRLENDRMKTREYYVLNSESIQKNKISDVNWYDYFITVISISENSDKVVVINFGND